MYIVINSLTQTQQKTETIEDAREIVRDLIEDNRVPLSGCESGPAIYTEDNWNEYWDSDQTTELCNLLNDED